MAEQSKSAKASQDVTKRWIILMMLCLSPLLLGSIYLGRVKQGLGVWACAGIVTIAVKNFWDSRDRLWFWPLVVFAILVQVPFVVLVPWDNQHLSYVGLLPFGVSDYAVVYGGFTLAKRLTKGSDGAGSSN